MEQEQIRPAIVFTEDEKSLVAQALNHLFLKGDVHADIDGTMQIAHMAKVIIAKINTLTDEGQ